MLLRLSVSLLLFGGPLVLAKQISYYEQISDGNVYRVTGVDSGEFEVSRLVKIGLMFREELRRLQSRSGTLWIVTSWDDQYALVPSPPGEPYVQWRERWLQSARAPFRIARVSVVAGDARLEYRMSDGTSGRAILAGRDPFLVIDKGVRYEVAHMSISQRQGEGSGSKGTAVYNLVISCDKQSNSRLDRAIVRTFATRLGVPNLFVVIQSNTWFRERAPIVYPFAKVSPPPRTESSYIACSMLETQITCQ